MGKSTPGRKESVQRPPCGLEKSLMSVRNREDTSRVGMWGQGGKWQEMRLERLEVGKLFRLVNPQGLSNLG